MQVNPDAAKPNAKKRTNSAYSAAVSFSKMRLGGKSSHDQRYPAEKPSGVPIRKLEKPPRLKPGEKPPPQARALMMRPDPKRPPFEEVQETHLPTPTIHNPDVEPRLKCAEFPAPRVLNGSCSAWQPDQVR